jgi:hypothetical protein
MAHPKHSRVQFFEPEEETDHRAMGGGAFATAVTRDVGAAAEAAFEHACVARGCKLRTATRREQVQEHFDFVVGPAHALLGRTPRRLPRHAGLLPSQTDVGTVRVEVKATKAARRGCAPDDSLLYLELHAVGGKHWGWLYGSADILAFQLQPCTPADPSFLLVPRRTLVRIAHAALPMARRASHSGIKGTLYGRKHRGDCVLVLDRKAVEAAAGHEAAYLYS